MLIPLLGWNESNMSSVEQNTSSADYVACDLFDMSFDFQIPLLITAILCFFIGLVYTFFGYKLFKIVLFLTGFLFGSILIYLVCDKERFLPVLGNVGVGAGAGILLGLITMLVTYVGLFMTGFMTGLVSGAAVVMIIQIFYTPTTLWVSIGAIFGCGLFFSLLTLRWQRVMLMLNTAIVGAGLMAASVDYFLNQFRLLDQIWRALSLQSPLNLDDIIWLCWLSWLALGLWPVLTFLGSLVQFNVTSLGQDHRQEGFHNIRKYYRDRRTGQPKPGTPTRVTYGHSASVLGGGGHNLNVRAQDPHDTYAVGRKYSLDNPAHQNDDACSTYSGKPFRQLYQARRANGDVICQSYLESLQRLASRSGSKNEGGGHTMTSEHTTHLTVLTSNNGSPTGSTTSITELRNG